MLQYNNEVIAVSAKSEKFQRIAERRTNAVLTSLRLLGQCSNPRMYEYTEEQAKKMFREIDKELRRIKTSFDHRERDKQFRL